MEQLQYSNNQIQLYGKLNLLAGLIKITKKVIFQILSDHNKSLSIIEFNFINDAELLQINIDSLNHNYYTDIITFDYSDANIIEGDIYISIERVKDNAIQFKKENIEELIRVICHGVLHLVGYKDKSTNDIKVMREKEGYYIGVFKNKCSSWNSN